MTALNSQIAALVVALLGGLPSEAETNESRADALGYGLRYEEGIPSRERKQLDGSFEEALTKACAPPPCTENCTGARSALGVVVGGDSRNYTLRWVVTDPRLQAPLTRDSSCELCSLAEVEEQIATDLGALCSRLDALDAAPGRVQVSSDPSGARVLVDGRVKGRTPWTGELAPGEHQIELRARGYRAQQRTIVIVGGIEESEHVDLLAAQSQRPSWPAWLSLGAGVVLGVSGAVLIALHDKPWAANCAGENVDANGHCKFVYTTRPLGVGLTAVGLGALATGAGLMVWAERDSGRLSSLGLGFRGRF